ncbi:hypothetical protein EYF80_009735 [Liparis tanakae]|uniref:Uncharacterized protein n=1 Tax=Liparis tanakae TaxID=230148 RepID=A0A4Z2ISB2_9TELE|nr:hypothetical protein EYF80_009735 [Liparis tanakae]
MTGTAYICGGDVEPLAGEYPSDPDGQLIARQYNKTPATEDPHSGNSGQLLDWTGQLLFEEKGKIRLRSGGSVSDAVPEEAAMAAELKRKLASSKYQTTQQRT